KAKVRRPGKSAVGVGVANWMAGEAGLRIGLGRGRAGEKVDDGALAGARAADDGDVQRQRRLAVEKRPDAIAYQPRCRAKLARLQRLALLLLAVLLEPAQVVGELAN